MVSWTVCGIIGVGVVVVKTGNPIILGVFNILIIIYTTIDQIPNSIQ